jgi:hypothetical protein
MHNATQPTYVLTDEKLKKVAKGVKTRLNEKLPDQFALSQQSILQVLSQELFSMPYEEAKSTVLSQGVNVLDDKQRTEVSIGDTVDSKGGLSGSDDVTFSVDYNDFRASLMTMGWMIPLVEVKILKPYLHVINDMPDGILPGINFTPNASSSMQELSESWHDEDLVFGALMMALHYYASQGEDEFTLPRMRDVLTLNQAITWMNNASLPSEIKELLGRSLNANEIASNGNVRLNGLIKFDESVETYQECIGNILRYIDKENKLKQATPHTSVGECKPSPELVLLDAITTLNPLIPLHVMTDLECIKEQIMRVSKGKDDVVLTIRHQNALRKKEMGGMWHNRSYGLVRVYTDAYLCSVGVTMQGPRFFDLVAGFNLDNIAAMSKDKDLPFELRSELKSALVGLMYAWGSEDQPASTMENFAYVVAQFSESFDAIKSYILDNIE